jgi:hypothetical protein
MTISDNDEIKITAKNNNNDNTKNNNNNNTKKNANNDKIIKIIT